MGQQDVEGFGWREDRESEGSGTDQVAKFRDQYE